MTYTECAEMIDVLLEQRRKVSRDKYGMLAKDGNEAEHTRLTIAINEARKQLRRIRYGPDAE